MNSTAEHSSETDRKVRKIVLIVKRCYGSRADWDKVKRACDAGALLVDPAGDVRIAGDLFTRERFNRWN